MLKLKSFLLDDGNPSLVEFDLTLAVVTSSYRTWILQGEEEG